MIPFLYSLNVLCSAGQSALGKQYARRGGESLPFNINKALIGTLLFLVLGLMSGFSWHLETMLFGLFYGISLCISMHTGFKALSIGPMALTSIIASFSLIIPFLFGIILWNESLTLLKFFGVILLLLSIFLINIKKENGFSAKWLFYALVTLLSNGFCSVIQKMHQINFPTLYRTEFMFWALLCVSIILLVTHITKRNGKEQFEFSLLGIASGVANCCANYIVLYLSATENASVLFPIIAVANIVTVWVIGLLFFKERLKILQTIGLIIGVVSVVLLKI
jgi:drug/metabolite transporter (DMT)-like permease